MSSEHEQKLSPREKEEERKPKSRGNRLTSRERFGRHNKLYRCPPTPPLKAQLEKERSFVLDCSAVSSISGDYSRANPKLGPVVPPYNSQHDMHAENYFHFHGVQRTLRKTGQSKFSGTMKGTSIEGPLHDRFSSAGAGYQYLALRNKFGAGHSRDSIDGHSQFMQGVRPVYGYNGSFGYRRNTPWLRQTPSPFGTASRSPTQENVRIH